MAAVSNLRLIMLATEGKHRQGVLDQFARLNIDPQRIEFVGFQPRREYLQTYERIDLGLDCFPYNGHTTSLDSLWMGVPVITLIGRTVVGRAGWSQLSNLGLTELAANTPEQFVQIVTSLTSDLPRLSQLRSTLRQRMLQSPLTDAVRFARNIESAYRQMWRTWCEGINDSR
jgi:protein O-GlcNAc transferase